ncbi:response regulator [Micromonospora costi]|uniref:DNA-binding response regulator n=1 Tax=Micromonospora costi TaxID=1530042 RepID=A0A3B0A253_9ACTN|nr:response regulator transcription factor [Micromonospora costi]RKN54635.1 DNA-binding response regulator [Micromonospora costi]
MVVDDHPMWREGVARDLTEAGHLVVAATGEGRQAIRVAPAARPDLVVLDLQLPDISGVAVIQGLRAALPQVRVLMLSASGEQQSVLDAVKAGATGYLVKSAAPDEFLDAVRRTAAGEPVFTPGLAGLVLGEYRRLAAAPEGRDAGPAAGAAGEPVFTPGLAGLVLGEYRRLAAAPEGRDAGPAAGAAPRLTERETEVLRLVAKGLSYKQIATRLGLSHRTVQNHVQNTLGKLQLHNRVELTRYAIERGLDD